MVDVKANKHSGLELDVFVVQNQEGKFFRAKGYGGWGDSWVGVILGLTRSPEQRSIQRLDKQRPGLHSLLRDTLVMVFQRSSG